MAQSRGINQWCLWHRGWISGGYAEWTKSVSESHMQYDPICVEFLHNWGKWRLARWWPGSEDRRRRGCGCRWWWWRGSVSYIYTDDEIAQSDSLPHRRTPHKHVHATLMKSERALWIAVVSISWFWHWTPVVQDIVIVGGWDPRDLTICFFFFLQLSLNLWLFQNKKFQDIIFPCAVVKISGEFKEVKPKSPLYVVLPLLSFSFRLFLEVLDALSREDLDDTLWYCGIFMHIQCGS